MPRETKELKTPGGHTIVINAYLTGREKSALDGAITAALKVTPPADPSERAKMSEVSGAFYAEVEQKMMAYMVVSVDGEMIAPLDKLLDLPSAEYDFVKKEVDGIVNPTTPENSAQPGAGTSQSA